MSKLKIKILGKLGLERFYYVHSNGENALTLIFIGFFCSFLTVFWSFWQILLSKTCIKPHWGKLQLLLKKGAKNGAFLSPLRSTLYGSTFSWFEFQKNLRFCKIFSFLWITRKIFIFWTLERSLLPGKIQFPTTLYFISKICLLHKILRKSPVLKPENAIF